MSNLIVEGGYEGLFAGGSELIGELSSSAVGYILLPIIFFNNIDGVGEEEGLVDFYWTTHSVYDDKGIPVSTEFVEYDKITNPYARAENMPHGITNGFILSNSGPDDDNSSFIIKVVAVGMISMIISPPALLTISGIYNDLNSFYTSNTTKFSFKPKPY
ncbi:MAG: hypothetical protein MJ224_07485 [archaeon]|nr:hypothetical protein [archaeon]